LLLLVFSEIQNGVERLKQQLYNMIQDEDMWAVMEEVIDQFVENRRNGQI